MGNGPKLKLRYRLALCWGLPLLASLACSSEDGTSPGTDVIGTGAATSGGAGVGGTSTGGAASGTGATSTGGSPAGGTGGVGATGGSVANVGGTGGSTGGTSAGGTGGTGGTGDPVPDAVAVAAITSTDGGAITGTATFQQFGDTVTLVVELQNCPDGVHGTHLHQNKDCGDGGNAAGGHWLPAGEQIGDITCAGGAAIHEVSQPTTVWTIGDAGPQDVTAHSIMVHDGPTGPRIACGLVDISE